jgi:hypothetical protein
MFYVVKIEATNDANGNPRRGWLVMEPSESKAREVGSARDVRAFVRWTRTVAFVNEGYDGASALYSWLSGREFLDGGTIPTTPAFYRSMRKTFGKDGL